MSEHGKREQRLITVGCLVLGGTAVASAVSPAIERVLNIWVGVPVLVGFAMAGLAVLTKQAWSWALTEWEIRREPKPREDVKEVEWRA